MARLALRATLWVSAALSSAAVSSFPGDHAHGARLLRLDQVPLRTRGRYIVDNRGERVKWACVNWYGAYSTTHAVGGLEKQPMSMIVDRIVELGFNCVRMMYSTQGQFHNPLVENWTVAANPSLFGLRWLDIFDLTIKLLTDARLMVIINNHNSKSGWCCHYSQDEGLWYVPEYSEAQWINSLTFLAARYKPGAPSGKGTPFVVGIDLRNEVHDYEDTHLTWGDGNPKTDWALAATTAGNAVLQESPDVLIVVMAMCFGMDLRAMRKKPIELMYPNRVVYQAHNYLEYQVFDNVAKMLAPWNVIRWYLVVILALLALLSWALRCAWLRLGKPRPPRGLTTMSAGIWFALFMLIAACVSWYVFSFGMLFCSFSAHRDMLPWFIGSCILGGLSLIVAAIGCYRLWVGGCSRPSAPEPNGVPMPQYYFHEPRPPGPIDSEDAVRASAGTPQAGRSPCVMVWPVLCRDFYRWVRGLLGFACGPREELATASWDWGLTVCFECGLLAVLLILFNLLFYIFAHIVPTYWWMERHLDGLWGFALEEGFPHTAPVWMGEFGQEARGQYWLNFVRYLSIRDVDFAYWAINGIKYSEGKVDTISGNFINYDNPRWENETFGILSHDYITVRHTWKLMDLQALMESPARWTPDTFPCPYSSHSACGVR